jgi:hypothetical protein
VQRVDRREIGDAIYPFGPKMPLESFHVACRFF